MLLCVQACCGDHHKHYVVNTVGAKSMFGVCVRHNDDCTGKIDYD